MGGWYSVLMKSLFDGLCVVVTGGAGALGSAVVMRLLDAGARCVVPCFDAGELERSSDEDERVTLMPDCDLTDEAHVMRVFDEAERGPATFFGSVHVAGGFAMSPIESTSSDDWDKLMRMNARTCFLCTREAVRRLTHAKREGRIVNVAARPALEPRTGAQMVAYTASKAAVSAITQAVGEEVAGRGILVNAVAPSIIDTPANRDAMPDADHESWATTDDLSRTIVHLVSPENTCTRSAVVPVYGRS